MPGIGPWTAAEVGVRALGDDDAVSVGDFHLPNLVAYALAGEARGTDARMLELLEPYRGQRARVIRLLELSGHPRPTLRAAPLGTPDRGPLGTHPVSPRGTARPLRRTAATVSGVHGSRTVIRWSAPASAWACSPAAISAGVPVRPGDVGGSVEAPAASG